MPCLVIAYGVYGTSNGPQNGIGNYLGPCSMDIRFEALACGKSGVIWGTAVGTWGCHAAKATVGTWNRV